MSKPAIESKPVIEVVMLRDPDSATDFHLVINGKAVTDITVYDIDPGAGHEAEDYLPALVEDYRGATEVARGYLGDAIESAQNSHYVEGELECKHCGDVVVVDLGTPTFYAHSAEVRATVCTTPEAINPWTT